MSKWILSGALACVLAATPLGAQSLLLPLPSNGDFSRLSGRAPADWSVARRDGPPGIELQATQDRTGLIVPTTVGAGEWRRLYQRIDAAPWRGKRVRLSARIRVLDAGDHVGLRIAVQRPNRLRGFSDHMSDDPLGAGGWRWVALDGYVEDDATEIEIGAMIRGRASIEIDDVTFAEVDPGNAALSSEARAFLQSAIDFVRAQHMDSAAHDWDALSRRVRHLAAGAQTPRETYIAIHALIAAMGDNHGFFARAPVRPPAPSRGDSATSSPPVTDVRPLPDAVLVDGRFPMLVIPGLQTLSPADWVHARAYVRRLRDGITSHDDPRFCGWIIDLRGNGGGNMWPMLNGLAPLLGTPPFGAFVGQGPPVNWVVTQGQVTMENVAPGDLNLDFEMFEVRRAAAPVAVLIGPDTASSGESLTIAFAGRPEARSFGQITGGYTSANVTQPLSDGAVIGVPATWQADRMGRAYRTALAPDHPVAPGEEVAAATNWLASKCRAASG